MKQAEPTNYDDACDRLKRILQDNQEMSQRKREFTGSKLVALSFNQLVICAHCMAEGKPAEMNLRSIPSWLLDVANWAVHRARRHPVKDRLADTPDPVIEFMKALKTLHRLIVMPSGEAKRAEARRMEVEWARLHGATEMRAKWLLNQVRDKAKVEADQAEVKVRIAEQNVKLASREEQDKAESDLAKAKNDLAKAKHDLANVKHDLAKEQENRAMLEAIFRGLCELQASSKRTEGMIAWIGAMLKKLPGALLTILMPKKNYPPEMLEEAAALYASHPKYGDKQGIDWKPLLEKYHYNPDAKNAEKNFVRALQRYLQKRH